MARYDDFVRAGVGLPSLWQPLQGQIYLGGDAFLQQMQARPNGTQPLTHYLQANADRQEEMRAA